MSQDLTGRKGSGKIIGSTVKNKFRSYPKTRGGNTVSLIGPPLLLYFPFHGNSSPLPPPRMYLDKTVDRKELSALFFKAKLALVNWGRRWEATSRQKHFQDEFVWNWI